MKSYKILKDIHLSFLNQGEHCNHVILPEENGILESDGTAIWYINENGRHESVSEPNQIEIWLANGHIAETSEGYTEGEIVPNFCPKCNALVDCEVTRVESDTVYMTCENDHNFSQK